MNQSLVKGVRLCNLLIALFCLLLVSPASATEHLYTYRAVGMCDGVYVGQEHTPDRTIGKCLYLLTTELTLTVQAESQTVTFIEKDLDINKEWELKALNVLKAHDCKVVDDNNFNCSFFVRTGGIFVNTDLISGRKIHSSFVASKYAELNSGWIDKDLLDLIEARWFFIVYIFVGLLFFLGVIGSI